MFTPKNPQILFGAEGQSRTDITCFSDTHLDHLGYLGIIFSACTEPFTDDQGEVDAEGLEPPTFAM